MTFSSAAQTRDGIASTLGPIEPENIVRGNQRATAPAASSRRASAPASSTHAASTRATKTRADAVKTAKIQKPVATTAARVVAPPQAQQVQPTQLAALPRRNAPRTVLEGEPTASIVSMTSSASRSSGTRSSGTRGGQSERALPVNQLRPTLNEGALLAGFSPREMKSSFSPAALAPAALTPAALTPMPISDLVADARAAAGQAAPQRSAHSSRR